MDDEEERLLKELEDTKLLWIKVCFMLIHDIWIADPCHFFNMTSASLSWICLDKPIYIATLHPWKELEKKIDITDHVVVEPVWNPYFDFNIT